MNNEQCKPLKKPNNYYIKNREKILLKDKQRRENNKEEYKKRERDKYLRNKEKKLEYHRKRRQDPEVVKRIREIGRKHYYKKNPNRARRIKLSEEERKRNKRRLNQEYRKRKEKNDPGYAMKLRIRRAINNALDHAMITKSKKLKTRDAIGCTTVELKAYIESKFQPGMSWENRDKWHIDHIIPIATAKTEEDIYRLNHYTNLQPLWAIDNIKKGDKLPGEY